MAATVHQIFEELNALVPQQELQERCASLPMNSTEAFETDIAGFSVESMLDAIKKWLLETIELPDKEAFLDAVEKFASMQLRTLPVGPLVRMVLLQAIRKAASVLYDMAEDRLTNLTPAPIPS